jgi:hypothetical protein
MKNILCNRLLIGILGVVGGAGQVWAGTAYTTMPATNITATSATLNGAAASTVGLGGEFFHWGTTTQLGNNGAGTPQGVNGPVSMPITGLTCNTTYYFQFTGTPGKKGTTIQGQVLTFPTSACPQKYEDVNAGVIQDNAAAQGICPNVCASAKGTWSGQWTNITSPSVCGCWVPQ